MKSDKNYSLETILCHHGENKKDYMGAAVPPIFQNSTFTFNGWDSIDKAFDDPVNNCIYTRGKNPSVSMVEEKIAMMCNGERAKLFTSGMAAISSAIISVLNAGDHVITIRNIYGPANNFLNVYLKEKMKIEVTFVDGKNIEDIRKAIRKNTTLIYLETPSSAVFSLQDISKVAELAKENNITTMIDNTWATPYFQKPLDMGIDIELHSVSKYLGGHSDLVAGVVIGSEKFIRNLFLNEHALFGGKIAPFEAWLINRSLRTFPLRMEKHQENAIKIANYLNSHDKVNFVLYPGLKSFDQYELGKKQMTGYSGLMSFNLKTSKVDKIKTFVNTLKLFKLGVSWGGHESLVYAPAISYLKELPREQFEAMGISISDIRISVGLENYQDLICDLQIALNTIE